MKMLQKVCLTIAVIVLFQVSIVSVYAKPEVTDLGAFSGDSLGNYDTRVNDFNEKGQMVGSSNVDYRTDDKNAFLWENGVMTDLMPKANYSEAFDINEAGQVVGVYKVNENDNLKAFLWDKGVAKDLGKFIGDVKQVCINEKGQIVLYTYYDFDEHVYTNIPDGVFKEVEIPAGGDCEKLFLNDKGQFVCNSAGEVYFWDNGVIQEIKYRGIKFSYEHAYEAYGFNNSGQVVGLCYTREGKEHAFLWDNELTDVDTWENKFIDLDNGRDSSYAVAINDKRQVVGFYIEKDKLQAFLWENGKIKDIGEAYNISQYNIKNFTNMYKKSDGRYDVDYYCNDFARICINNLGNILWSYKDKKTIEDEEIKFEKTFLMVDGKIKNIEIPIESSYTGYTFPIGLNEKNQIIGYAEFGSRASSFICEDALAVEINGGNTVFTDAKPFVDSKSGRTLIPLRFISEKLGAEVSWDSDTKTVGIKKDEKSVALKIGDSSALVDGVNIKLDATAAIKSGRTYVPLRFVSELLGAKVDWNGDTKTISISAKIINDKLQKELEDLYIEFQKHYKGNIDEVKEYLSTYSYVTTKNAVMSLGDYKPDSEDLESISRIPQISDYKLHNVFRNGQTVGLVYEKPREEKIIEYMLLKFVQENGKWKYDESFITSKIDKEDVREIFSEEDIPKSVPIDGKVITDIQLLKNVEIPRAYLSIGSATGYNTSVSVNNAEPVITHNEFNTGLIIGGLKKGENTINIKITSTHPKIDNEELPKIEVYFMDEKYEKKETVFTNSGMGKTLEINKTFICK